MLQILATATPPIDLTGVAGNLVAYIGSAALAGVTVFGAMWGIQVLVKAFKAGCDNPDLDWEAYDEFGDYDVIADITGDEQDEMDAFMDDDYIEEMSFAEQMEEQAYERQEWGDSDGINTSQTYDFHMIFEEGEDDFDEEEMMDWSCAETIDECEVW